MKLSRSAAAIAAHVIAVLVSVPAVAQVTGSTPTTRTMEVDSLVDRALANAPSLAALRARAASAEDRVEPAGALPDPMVGVMYQSIGPPWAPMSPMSMGQIEFSQSFPGVGKRAARRTAARAMATLREAELRALRAGLARDVRMTYASVYALDSQQRALKAARELVSVLLAAVTGRYQSGQLDQEALVKMQLEQSNIDQELTDLEAQRVALVAQLNQLTARADATPLNPVEKLPEPNLNDRELMRRVLERSPDLTALRAAIASAERDVQAAETEQRPNWFLGLAGGATVGGDPVITLRAGMELPLWRASKQDPLVRAASKDVEAAREDLAAEELRLREQVNKLIAQWRRDVEQVNRYRKVIIPQTELALNAARAGYQTGRADFSTVIEDFRRWLDAQIGLAQREADQYTTWAALWSLTDTGAVSAKGRAR